MQSNFSASGTVVKLVLRFLRRFYKILVASDLCHNMCP